MIEIEKLILQKHVDYSTNLKFVGGQITRDGTLLLIESNAHELDFFQRPVPKSNWTIKIIKSEGIETVELKNVPLMPSKADLFSDGTLLIVQSRCLKDGDNIERNARRYNTNGQLIEAFTLGDGISHVQIDETDTIWVGYFDEGVYGNFGWEQPMGSDGFIAYSINGQKLWGGSDYDISDCYALNVVSSKEVYFSYYTDFYLIQLSDMKESLRYRIESFGIQQFMFDKKGLIGQIIDVHNSRDMFPLMRFLIENRTITPMGKLQLIDEKGKQIKGRVFMRGAFLYVYGKDGIYKRKL